MSDDNTACPGCSERSPALEAARAVARTTGTRGVTICMGCTLIVGWERGEYTALSPEDIMKLPVPLQVELRLLHRNVLAAYSARRN